MVEEALQQLPEDQAMAIRLHHVQGLELSEVAKRMERSVGSIKMLCNRGMVQLREKLRSISRFL
jgi:RNA polymerase sigma factor (sigma-70 family)